MHKAKKYKFHLDENLRDFKWKLMILKQTKSASRKETINLQKGNKKRKAVHKRELFIV